MDIQLATLASMLPERGTWKVLTKRAHEKWSSKAVVKSGLLEPLLKVTVAVWACPSARDAEHAQPEHSQPEHGHQRQSIAATVFAG